MVFRGNAQRAGRNKGGAPNADLRRAQSSNRLQASAEAVQRKAGIVLFVTSNRTTLMSFVLLLMYFAVGVIYLVGAEGWHVGDVLYFAVVVLTTVGYGDLIPVTDSAKVFTALYAVFALVIAACAISNLMDALALYAAQRAAQAKRSGQQGLVAGQSESPREVRRRLFFRNFCIFVLLIAVGTVFFGTAKDWEGEGADGDPWVNSFYLTVLTLTTMGFGDFSCTTIREKLFGVCFMLIGIPCFANSLQAFTEYVFGDQKDKIRLKLVQDGLSIEDFDGMEEFCSRLAKAAGSEDDGDCADDGRVSRFEFLSFVLVENQVVTMDMIRDAMRNFRELDCDGGGYINKEDVQEWIRRKTQVTGPIQVGSPSSPKSISSVSQAWPPIIPTEDTEPLPPGESLQGAAEDVSAEDRDLPDQGALPRVAVAVPVACAAVGQRRLPPKAGGAFNQATAKPSTPAALHYESPMRSAARLEPLNVFDYESGAPNSAAQSQAFMPISPLTGVARPTRRRPGAVDASTGVGHSAALAGLGAGRQAKPSRPPESTGFNSSMHGDSGPRRSCGPSQAWDTDLGGDSTAFSAFPTAPGCSTVKPFVREVL